MGDSIKIYPSDDTQELADKLSEMDEGPRATGVFDYCIEERCKSSPLKEDALTPSSPVYFYRSADEWSSMCWSGVNPALLCVMCVHANKIASIDCRLVMGMSLDLQVRNKTVKTPKKKPKKTQKSADHQSHRGSSSLGGIVNVLTILSDGC